MAACHYFKDRNMLIEFTFSTTRIIKKSVMDSVILCKLCICGFFKGSGGLNLIRECAWWHNLVFKWMDVTLISRIRFYRLSHKVNYLQYFFLDLHCITMYLEYFAFFFYQTYCSFRRKEQRTRSANSFYEVMENQCKKNPVSAPFCLTSEPEKSGN